MVHLLEMARAITNTRVSFEYTLRICFFSGEEQGLLGSRAYARQLADDNVDVIAMFNADMLGWRLPDKQITVGVLECLLIASATWEHCKNQLPSISCFLALFFPRVLTPVGPMRLFFCS